MPVPVEEIARGNNPTGVVLKRDAAASEREQQRLKHCLERKSYCETKNDFDVCWYEVCLLTKRYR